MNPSETMSAPLADLTVVAVEQYGAGPFGTLQLAGLGAEVIKIEDPSVGGDVSRYVPPFQDGESSLFFESFNRNKRSVSLDLRHPKARGVLEDIVRESDAVFSNLRGDQPAKLGLRHSAVLEPCLRSKTTSEWLEVLGKAGVPCGPVNDIAEALEDPQVGDRDGILETEHPVLGSVRSVASPLRIDGLAPPRRRGPLRGEDTAWVLRGMCGYGEEQVVELERDGVFGDIALNTDRKEATE